MQGYFQKGGAYPLTVIPKGNDTYEVRNLETDESHGTFDSISAATEKQEEVREAALDQLAAQKAS